MRRRPHSTMRCGPACEIDDLSTSSWPGLSHGCPARFVLEVAHGIDSTRFQLVANHLDSKKDQRRAAPEYRFPWVSEAYSVVDFRAPGCASQRRPRSPRAEDQGPSDCDAVCAADRRTRFARDRNQSQKSCL